MSSGKQRAPVLQGKTKQCSNGAALLFLIFLSTHAHDFFREHFSVEMLFTHIFKRDDAGSHGKERVVATDADIGAGDNMRAALANDNLAGLHLRAVSALHTEEFRL